MTIFIRAPRRKGSAANYTECAIRLAFDGRIAQSPAPGCCQVRRFLRARGRIADGNSGDSPLSLPSPPSRTDGSNREEAAMIKLSSIDDVARRLAELVPADARAARDDLVANFRDALRSGLRRLDLVTREEFDVQRGVLLRTREMVEALEARVAELEERIG
jgi:BMFP domain-containing protein YqiC